MIGGVVKTVAIVVVSVLLATEVAPRLLAHYTADPSPVHRVRTLACDPNGHCWSKTVPPLSLDVCVDCFTPPRDPHLLRPFARHRELP